MKAEPLVEIEKGYAKCEPHEATHIRLNMPGPIQTRILPLKADIGPTWDWNLSVDKPTLTPSILTSSEGAYKKIVCHSFIIDGKVKFLNDCTHQFAGKTVDLLDIDP